MRLRAKEQKVESNKLHSYTIEEVVVEKKKNSPATTSAPIGATPASYLTLGKLMQSIKPESITDKISRLAKDAGLLKPPDQRLGIIGGKEIGHWYRISD